MKRVALFFCLLPTFSGCMEHQLRDKAVKLTKTTTDLFFIQVLDNVARTLDSPNEMPYFDVPAAGTIQLQQQLSIAYTPQWGLSLAASSFGFGKMLFNQQQAAFTPQQIDSEAWQVTPMADPDRLMLMHCAYLKATGKGSPYSQSTLDEYYHARQAWVDVTIRQTDYTKLAWDLWQQMMDRANLVLYWFHRFNSGEVLTGQTAEEMKIITAIQTGMKEEDYKKAKSTSAKLTFILGFDNAYQEIKAKYDILVPPPQPTPSAQTLVVKPKNDGKEVDVTQLGGGGSGGGGSSSPPGGGGGAGGKPPLPIRIPYEQFLQPGWYCCGNKCDVPRDACFVGHHGKTYVWVNRDPNQMDGLNRFTLAILDFYNIGNSGSSNIPQPPPATLSR